MRSIELTQGKVAIVDDDDFEFLSRWKWHFDGDAYARRRNKSNGPSSIFMHRDIMQTPPGLCTDHINGNGLDNRKSNLRICTKAQNNYNVGLINTNKSGFKGVSFIKQRSMWYAYIELERKTFNLGYYHTPKEAALAYDAAAKELFGEFAKLNFGKGGDVIS